MLVLVAYIFWQRHQIYRFREAGRFNSFYAKNLRALADKTDIELLIEKKSKQLYLWNFGTIIGIAVLVFSALNYFKK